MVPQHTADMQILDDDRLVLTNDQELEEGMEKSSSDVPDAPVQTGDADASALVPTNCRAGARTGFAGVGAASAQMEF